MVRYASDSMSFARQRSQMHEEAQLCAYKLREARRAYEQDKEDVKLHYRTTKRSASSVAPFSFFFSSHTHSHTNKQRQEDGYCTFVSDQS